MESKQKSNEPQEEGGGGALLALLLLAAMLHMYFGSSSNEYFYTTPQRRSNHITVSNPHSAYIIRSPAYTGLNAPSYPHTQAPFGSMPEGGRKYFNVPSTKNSMISRPSKATASHLQLPRFTA
jgi:hypothetical protein